MSLFKQIGALLGSGLTNGSNTICWHNGYSTDSIESGSMVAHSSNSGGNPGESQTAFVQALGTTTALSCGRLLYSINSNASTDPSFGPLKLVDSWLHTMTTTGATVGDPIYLNDSGAPSLTAGTIIKIIGWVDVVGAAGVGRAYVNPSAVATRWFTKTQIVASSSNVTNTVTKTAFDKTVAIPARHLSKGSTLRIRGAVRFSSTNSTDTALIHVLLGSVDLLTSAAVDVADGDAFVFNVEVTIRDAFSATAAIVANASGGFTTSGQNAKVYAPAAGTVDTTGALNVSVDVTWSVASASNICALEQLTVERLNP